MTAASPTWRFGLTPQNVYEARARPLRSPFVAVVWWRSAISAAPPIARLHQLRGRVGRGGKEGTCLLLYAPPLGETAKARLSILRQTEDGFLIAEEDLRLRGGGEMLGTRQSGLPEFKLANLSLHADLVAIASDDAQLIIARDSELQTPRGQALRTLLYLFEQDDAIRMLRSG